MLFMTGVCLSYITNNFFFSFALECELSECLLFLLNINDGIKWGEKQESDT